MDPAQFTLGDKAWGIRATKDQVRVTCPDCLGKKALTVILGDDSQVSIDCDCCKWPGPHQGTVADYIWQGQIVQVTIEGVGQSLKAAIQYSTHPWCQQEYGLFHTEEDAQAGLQLARTEHEAREKHKLESKDKPHKSWAFHVQYHRSQVERAKKDLAYATAKLSVAQAKSRTPEEGEDRCEKCEKLKEELRVTEEILTERNRLLEAIPECSVHGKQCVPHAIQWVQAQVLKEGEDK